MNFPVERRVKLHSTNLLKRLCGEIERRGDVVGIFPNEEAVVQLAAALLPGQNDR